MAAGRCLSAVCRVTDAPGEIRQRRGPQEQSHNSPSVPGARRMTGGEVGHTESDSQRQRIRDLLTVYARDRPDRGMAQHQPINSSHPGYESADAGDTLVGRASGPT